MKRKISFKKFLNIVLIINLIAIIGVFIFNNLINELEFHYNLSFVFILAINITLIIILNKFKDKKYVEDIMLFLVLLYVISSFWIPVCSEGESGINKTNSGVTIPYGYSKSYNYLNLCIDETHIH